MIKLDLPMYIVRNKQGDKYSLNLNAYRNTHYQTLNGIKKKFAALISEEVLSLPQMETIAIVYILYLPTKRKSDIANVCSVVDKFFCDVLVTCKTIPDDNCEHLPLITSVFGGVDKNKGRVEAYICPIPEDQNVSDRIQTQIDVLVSVQSFIHEEKSVD